MPQTLRTYPKSGNSSLVLISAAGMFPVLAQTSDSPYTDEDTVMEAVFVEDRQVSVL